MCVGRVDVGKATCVLPLSGAKASSNDVLVGPELVSEIGHSHAECLRIVVRAVAGALLRAERAGEVVVGEGNVGAVLRGEGYLEEIGRGAACAAGAAVIIGENRSA